MKVSYQWLQRYFDKKLPKPEELAEALTFHAFEIDGIEKIAGDTVLDVKVLPDRAHDCFSHRGIAKEISAIFEIPLLHDPLAEPTDLTPTTDKLKVWIDDRTLSPRYSAALIEGVKVGPSPQWLQELLQTIGQKPINNIVDATNFVMFDMGQPLHAFDAGKLSEKDGHYMLGVRAAKSGEKIETLDGKSYELTPTDSLIINGHRDHPVGIAGIKGGKAAEINNKTKDIIIESANFAHVPIRKTSTRLKLRTDASVRFEHELSPELTAWGIQEAAKLIIDLAGGTLVGFADEYPLPQGAHRIEVTPALINNKLGIALTSKEVEKLLTRLALSFQKKGDVFAISVPQERLDLKIPEDMVAEVGRLFGYEHVTPVVPDPLTEEDISKRFYYAEKIRHLFEHGGYSEVITTSFARKGGVRLVKSVASDRECLRSSLRENLLESLKQNRYNADLLGLSEVQMYEIGTVFKKEKEAYHLAWLVDGRKDKKEVMQHMLQLLVDNLGLPLSSCADCIVTEGTDDVVELNIGEIIDRLPAPTTHSVAELHPLTAYRPFSPYPFVLRDIAMFTPTGSGSKEEAETVIKEHVGPLLARLRLFDEFKKGEKTSYAFRLVFQSMERTLTDVEVGKIMEEVTKALTEKGYEIR